MKYTVVIAFLLVLASLTVEAQRRAGGAGVRAGGAAHVNRDVASTSIRSNQDVNRNVNRNANVNRNFNGGGNQNRGGNNFIRNAGPPGGGGGGKGGPGGRGGRNDEHGHH